MTPTTSNPGAPRTVLLATDLSARGDRALERAIADAAPAGTRWSWAGRVNERFRTYAGWMSRFASSAPPSAQKYR